MYDRPVRRLLVLIVCIVLFNIALTVYWLVVDNDNLKQSNLREQESQRTHSDYNDQIQPYLESPILPLTPNPVIDERDGTNKPHLPWYFKDGTMRPIIGTSYRISGARSPGVWPEETAAGDRVEEQLMFVPWRYDHDGALTKNILVYNDFDGWTVEAGQNEFLSKGCPVNRCAITTDKSEGPTADAILFRNEFSTPNHRKPGNQVWIMAVVRSAYYTELDRVDENAINWTATYRHDSDVVLPFGRWAYYDPSAAQVEQGRRNYALNKTRQAAMYVSRCDTDNGRLAYAKTLGEYMTVDVYGACAGAETVDPDDFLAMLERDYKFYLAFEDSDCADYVTGQFFDNGLRRGVLPIAMGGRREDYERIAPKWSYVYAGDFGSPEELAEHLHRLDADDGLYNEYFRWRGTGEFIDTRFFCRLCAMLHDGGAPVKHYRDFGAWWSGPGVCERPVAPLQERGAASEREKTGREGADEYDDVSYGDDETADASSRTGEHAAV